MISRDTSAGAPGPYPPNTIPHKSGERPVAGDASADDAFSQGPDEEAQPKNASCDRLGQGPDEEAQPENASCSEGAFNQPAAVQVPDAFFSQRLRTEMRQ